MGRRRGRPWWGRRRRRRPGRGLGGAGGHGVEETHLRPTLGEGDHVALLQIGVVHRLTVHVATVGAVIEQQETVTLALDLSVIARNEAQLRGECDVRGGGAADGDHRLAELVDLPFAGTVDVNDLQMDVRDVHVSSPGWRCCIGREAAPG